MTDLVHHDEQVKQDEDLEQDEDNASDMQNHVVSRGLVNRWTRHSVCRCKFLTFCRLQAPLRLRSRPLIRSQYCIEIGVCNGRMPIHHIFYDSPDVRKSHSAI